MEDTSASSTSRTYLCEHCQETFSNLKKYHVHLEIHAAEDDDMDGSDSEDSSVVKKEIGAAPVEAEPVCQFCSQRFGDLKTLERHWRTKHSKENPFRCSMCSEAFSLKGALTKHMNSAHQNEEDEEDEEMEETDDSDTFQCTQCESTFNSAAKLQVHMKSHEKIKNLVCDICSKQFFFERHLKNHLKTHQNQAKPAGKLTSPQKEFTCSVCQKEFDKRSTYLYHVRTHDASSKTITFTCAQCGENFNSQNVLTNHMRRSHPDNEYVAPSFSCDVCSKSFESYPKLKKHMNLHPDNSAVLHPCPICQAAFLDLDALSAHMVVHQDKPAPYRCTICDQGYYTQVGLEKHQMGHVDLVCQTCGKVFSSKLMLENHERTVHAAALFPESSKQFLCQICRERRFATLPELESHIMTHASDYDPKKTTCDICGKVLNKTAIQNHMMMHSGARPFPCDWCGKKFRQAVQLAVHKRTHTDERPYECDFCEKRFRQKTHLNTHRTYHTDERKIKCKMCDSLFRTHSDMHDHLKRKHLNPKRTPQEGEVVETLILI